MQLSRDQVKTILNNAPAGADKKKILDGLITRGYQLEGVDSNAAKQAMQPAQPEQSTGANRFTKELADRSSKIAETVSNIGADTPVLQTSLDIANQVVGAPAAAVYKALPQSVQDFGTKAGEVAGKTVAKLTDFISDSPMLQKFVTENPEKARQLEDVFGAIKSSSELVGNAAALTGAPKVLSNTTDTLTRLAGNTVKPVVSKTKNLVGRGLESTGEKIQTSVIRPSGKDISDGFKIENVNKYDLGGSLPETIAKTHTKLNELSGQLREKLTGSDNTIDLNQLLKETTEALTSGKTASFGDNQAIQRVLDNIKEEIAQASETGIVDLVDATNIKRAAGTKGAWAYNRPEVDASAIEKVYTEFYDKMKTAIETNAPDGVKEINKQISELIPINNAALRRLPVADRNNALSLTDTIGLTSAVFDARALLIMGAQKASKSGRVGNALVKAGKAVKGFEVKGANINPKVNTEGALPGMVSINGTIYDVKKLVDKENPYSGAAAFIDNSDRAMMREVKDYVSNGKPLPKELSDKMTNFIVSFNNLNKKAKNKKGVQLRPNASDLTLSKQFDLILDADRELTKKAIEKYGNK